MSSPIGVQLPGGVDDERQRHEEEKTGQKSKTNEDLKNFEAL